jgi:hypothetical protein
VVTKFQPVSIQSIQYFSDFHVEAFEIFYISNLMQDKKKLLAAASLPVVFNLGAVVD